MARLETATHTHTLTHLDTQEKNSRLDILTEECVIHLCDLWHSLCWKHLLNSADQSFSSALSYFNSFMLFIVPVMSHEHVFLGHICLWGRYYREGEWALGGLSREVFHQHKRMWDMYQPQVWSTPSTGEKLCHNTLLYHWPSHTVGCTQWYTTETYRNPMNLYTWRIEEAPKVEHIR